MRHRHDVYLVFEGLRTATPSEVADTAARLGLTFPSGYAEYVTGLGEGTLSGYLHIWLPGKVRDDLPEHRRRLSGHFFWDEDGPLTPARARETVILGDTMDGDDLVFHPDRPDDLFVLPRHKDRVYRVGPGLDAAIDWLCDSGVLTRPMTFRYFEPDGDRERIDRSIPLPYEVVRDALVELGLHDHVGFDERPGDGEKVFDVKVKVGDRFEEVDDEDVGIMLLIKEFCGDVTATNGSPFGPGSTDVSITHVADAASAKLDRLLGLLDELDLNQASSQAD